MSSIPTLPWIHLADALHPSRLKLRVVLDKIPTTGHKVLAQLFVSPSTVPVDNPGRLLESEPRLSIRQKACLNLFIQSDPFSSKRDRYVMSPQSVSTLLSLSNEVAIEIKDLGVIAPSTDRARLVAQLAGSSIAESVVEFRAFNSHAQALESPSVLGVDETFLLDENLRLFRVDPPLMPTEVRALLGAEPLAVADLNTFEAKALFETIAELGVDWSSLQKLAQEDIVPQIVLRALLNSANGVELRIHLVAVIGDEEIEIPAKGALAPVLSIGDAESFHLVKRNTQLEEQARRWLFSLGAVPSHLNRGFRAVGQQALHILSKLSRGQDLPEGLTVDTDTLPRIIELPEKPLLSLVADATGSMLNAQLKIDDELMTGSLDEWIHLASTGATAMLRGDDTVVTFTPESIQALATLSETLDLNYINLSKSIPFFEAALLVKSMGDSVVIDCNEALMARLQNFIPELLPEDKTLPTALKASLRPYQHDAVAWMSQMHRAGLGRLLADDMGLGKTLMVLTLVAKIKEQYGKMPTLVVAPTSVIDVWQQQAAEHFCDLSVMKWHGATRAEQADDIQHCDILVTSYSLLRRDIDFLSTIQFRYLILDEAQNIKNPRTESWKAARRIVSEQRLALSGTPIENRLLDLYSIVEMVAPSILGHEKTFTRRYITQTGAASAERMNELRERLRPLILRRKKSDVESDLPPKIESILKCNMSTEQRQLYLSLLQQAQSEIGTLLNDSKASMHLLALLTRLRQVCADPNLLPNVQHVPSAKAELFVEVLTDCLAMGRRIIIYSQFVKMQEMIHEILKANGVDNALWLHGATRNRAEVIKQFQDPNGPSVIVVSLKAGGTGVTLTAADTVIYYDPWWNPAVMDQAADRAHRIGQTKTVHLIKLICENSIEEQILALSEKKRAIADDMLTTDRPGARSLTLDDIRRLLTTEIERVKTFVNTHPDRVHESV